jgi:hypothetical protein
MSPQRGWVKMPESNIAARVVRLEKQLADLQARLPAHSIPPSMIAELDELEETLAQARRQWQEKSERGGGRS